MPTAHGYSSQHFSWAFVLIHPINVALPHPEIGQGTQKIWAVPGYAHAYAPSFQRNLMGFSSDASYE